MIVCGYEIQAGEKKNIKIFSLLRYLLPLPTGYRVKGQIEPFFCTVTSQYQPCGFSPISGSTTGESARRTSTAQPFTPDF